MTFAHAKLKIGPSSFSTTTNDRHEPRIETSLTSWEQRLRFAKWEGRGLNTTSEAEAKLGMVVTNPWQVLPLGQKVGREYKHRSFHSKLWPQKVALNWQPKKVGNWQSRDS
ncbi:hypothetical protein CDAR_183931 [Caerostris darwini]|uniref:Uncharacterized protein n=1 Tax=Caerostris darwini TaxID=1538125 RepID=A0AAV4TXU6_9ARAC|nr:hypothetical protein CDAR_183931 [Caerostris darwini]